MNQPKQMVKITQVVEVELVLKQDQVETVDLE
jgi:hypothetical protein